MQETGNINPVDLFLKKVGLANLCAVEVDWSITPSGGRYILSVEVLLRSKFKPPIAQTTISA